MNAVFALSALLALAPGQGASPVGVSNARLTFGELGPARPDNRYLPRDFVFISFDIDGLKATADGKVTYSMGLEVIDKAGKAMFSAPPTKSEMLLPLGGAKLPAFVYVTLGPDMAPGVYTCRITVTDDTNKASKTVDQKFELMPPAFGLVQLYVSKDDKGMLACGPNGVSGQTVFVNFGLVGFNRDATKKPDAAVEFRVLDANGQPTLSKPIIMPVPREFPEAEPFVPFQVMLPMNREGKYTVEMKAADKVGGKTTVMTFPVTVYPAAK
jgi:hypothetical protein